MRYLSIDIESTGLNPDNCQILQIAAVCEDTKRDIPINRLPSFNAFVLHPKITGEPVALEMNKWILDLFEIREATIKKGLKVPNENEFVSVNDVFAKLAIFMNRCIPGDNRYTLAGKNLSSFDMRFMERLPGFNKDLFKHRVIDPSILYWKPFTDSSLPDMETCIARSGIDASPYTTHQALDDARLVIELVRKGTNGKM